MNKEKLLVIFMWVTGIGTALAGALFIDALVVLVAIANQIQGKERR